MICSAPRTNFRIWRARQIARVGVVAVYAEIAGGLADAAFVATPSLRNRLNLRRFLRQPDPLSNVLVAFKRLLLCEMRSDARRQ
jgi:hypothetical protein